MLWRFGLLNFPIILLSILLVIEDTGLPLGCMVGLAGKSLRVHLVLHLLVLPRKLIGHDAFVLDDFDRATHPRIDTAPISECAQVQKVHAEGIAAGLPTRSRQF